MASLTLAIDDRDLRAARVRAATEDTSVNAVAREAIVQYAQGASFGSDARQRLLREAFSVSLSSGGRKFTREELHER
ncbi:MAG: hypothetical protein LBM66_06285 [Bifidobacteriaceae bacterium]|jgi:plasmid stability protein|nr:hypothetical protein [Bifidobacteriaceae bacterium]